MKTYLIPTTAHVAVKLSQQLLDVSPVISHVEGDGPMPTPPGGGTTPTD